MINGNPNPTVGKDEYYTLVDYSLGLAYLDVSSKYTWRIKKKVRGAWKDITKEPPKTGISVPFKFGEAVIGEEFTIEVYKETKNIFTQKNETHKMGEIIVIPKSSKAPKITKVVLFNRGARDINKASYTDRLIARAYCVGMFNKTIDFHLWEDDAAGGGHHAEINKNNRSNRVYSARVNRDGIAEVEISLSADQRVLRQIANRMMMSGDKDEGKYHEFYVTASYQGKILKANEKNVAVENPDYKQKPKEYTPKFPATPTSHTPTQQDKEGKIKAAYFVNDKNQKLVKTTVGEEVKVQIITQGMVGKHLQYRVWEYDFSGNHDEIYSSPRLKVVGDIMTHVSGFKITKERFQKGVDIGYIDSDFTSQNYFIEVVPLDISVSSKKFGIDTSVGLMTVAVEKTRTPTKVGEGVKKEEKGTCVCKQYDLIWGDKVSCKFRKKVVEIAKKLGLPQKNYEGANWLMTVMALETAYTFSPKCGTFGKNPDESSKYKYIGLIQFGKVAADEIQTTRTHLMSLTAEEQLDYVEKYFKKKQFKNLLKNRTALYLAVNYPNSTKHAIEKNYVVYDSTKAAYDDNPMFKRETHEFWIDKKGKKQYYKGKEGKTYVWEFEEALKEVEELGKSKKTQTFNCVDNNTIDNVNAKDIVTYRIYHNGKIEKHIPKNIKNGYEKKYKYVYHDSKNIEHEICTAEWHITKEKGVGQVYKSKPTHSKIVYDNNVSEGNTTRRVKYENGDIAEYGNHPRKGIIWLLYKAGSNNVELLKMPDSLNYKKDNVYIAYDFSKTQRRYTGVDSFAGFIGFLAKAGYKLTTTGSCFSEGSSFPSQEHCNGRSVDTLYLGSVEKDQKVIDSAIFFHFTEVLKGTNNYCRKLVRAGNGGVLHNSHLHAGNFNDSVIKIIKEQ